MDEDTPDPVFDAFLAASQRGEMPTSLDTEGLRELSAELRSRMVFVARGTNAIFVSKVKEVIDELAAGNINEAGARVALVETLRALGYTPEGGFPETPEGAVPPAVAGTLQDLSSFRRLDLIVDTQIKLVQGKGLQAAGHEPERLEAFPAWEIFTLIETEVPRDWAARWTIAGGKFWGEPDGDIADAPGRLIALKGDPVWGELGASANFSDALDVDYPPFYFRSGKWVREVPREETIALGVTGPDGQSIDDWFAERPRVLSGELPLPLPSLSMKDVDPDLVDEFVQETKATAKPGSPGVFDYSALLREELAAADKAYGKGGDR